MTYTVAGLHSLSNSITSKSSEWDPSVKLKSTHFLHGGDGSVVPNYASVSEDVDLCQYLQQKPGVIIKSYMKQTLQYPSTSLL